MKEEKKNDQVNVDFSKFPELLEELDEMVAQDDLDRSKFIRKLVREEKIRRLKQLPLPLPKSTKPNSRKASAALAA